MGVDTKIEWTHHTFNPWWGCQRVSPGCEHCYAETFSKRVGLKVWGPTSERRFFGDKHWAEPLKWNRDAERAGERRRVFCASMADVFENRRDLDDPRKRLRRLIEETPWLDWLLLTKRPENMALLPSVSWPSSWWPRNVWAGCTVEDRQRAHDRIPHLLSVSAAIRFLSVEPQLEHIDLSRHLTAGIHWVIVGGESGPGARPFYAEWAVSIVEQCRTAGVACFVKQMGSNPHIMPPACRGWVPMHLKDRKGGDMAEWPERLRVRQFPEVRT